MIEFFEKTWLLWWFCSILVILRWFHLAHLSETIELETDQPESEKQSTAAA